MRPRRCEHEVRLFELTLLLDQNRSRGSWPAGIESLRSYARATLTTIKRTSHKLHQTIVVNVSCRCNNQVAVRKLARVEANSDLVIERRNRFPRALDGTAERLIGKV